MTDEQHSQTAAPDDSGSDMPEPVRDTSARSYASRAGSATPTFRKPQYPPADQDFVGLGMSGGGFRASLYHLGTLSALAESDALRNVDFVSTVSGGSLIGVHFHLRMRKLLQSKPDEEITREDYIEVVEDVTRSFVELITTKDCYWRSYLNPLSNFWRTINGGSWVHIEHIVTNMERQLYSQFQTEEELASKELCSLERLRIQPPDEADDFLPYIVNNRRKAKVPVLLVNATCLNSGHRFVWASDAIPPPKELAENDSRLWSYMESGGWLGEIIDPKYSSIATLPVRKYRHLSKKCRKKMTMATAAASSAAVPLLFVPISVPALYPTRKHYRVVLVDGSISDNTGLETLRDAGSTTMLMSNGGVEVPEDSRIAFRQNALAVTARAMSLLMVQAEQDRLLAVRRSKFLPIVHMSLAFDSRFRESSIQEQLNENMFIVDEDADGNDNGSQSRWSFGKTKPEEKVVVEALDEAPDVRAPYSIAEEEEAGASDEGDMPDVEGAQNSVEMMIPHNNHTVVSLIGVVRTHLDLFTEVECTFIMGVAYIEALIKLAAEQKSWKANASKAREVVPWLRESPPWEPDHLRTVISGRGHVWSFLPIVAFLVSSQWGRTKMPACPACAYPSAYEKKRPEGEEEFYVNRLDSNKKFRNLVKDLYFQMTVSRVVYPRCLALFPKTGLALTIIVLVLLAGGIAAFIVWLVNDFWTYPQRDCTLDYREHVWLPAAEASAPNGEPSFSFYDILYGPENDPTGTLRECETALLIDGDALAAYPDADELLEYVNLGYNEATDILAEDQNAWVKPLSEAVCVSMLGPSDVCRNVTVDNIDIADTEITTFSDACLAEPDHEKSTGGTVTCRQFFESVRDAECAAWDNREISRSAVIVISVFSVLLVFLTKIIPALILGLIVFPLAALWDLCVVTPFTRRRGSMKPFSKFLKEAVMEKSYGADNRILTPKQALDGFQNAPVTSDGQMALSRAKSIGTARSLSARKELHAHLKDLRDDVLDQL